MIIYEKYGDRVLIGIEYPSHIIDSIPIVYDMVQRHRKEKGCVECHFPGQHRTSTECILLKLFSKLSDEYFFTPSIPHLGCTSFNNRSKCRHIMFKSQKAVQMVVNKLLIDPKDNEIAWYIHRL